MLAPGTTVGRYVVQKKLAEGGMAEIYLASAVGVEGFSKDVVIKVVRSFLATDSQFVQMFIAEARLASRLNHANVVQIFDFGKHDETYFLAMEFIRGASLWDLRKRCREYGVPFPPVLAAEIVAQVARGLQYAHNLSENGQKIGVVHRDVTPHNVLLSFDGAVKLTDFGIAKATTSQTAPGMLKGKFAYMSPEQGRGEKVDNRTDIFALGIVLWELLTGGRLFDGDTDVAVLRAVQDSLIAPPSRLNPDVPQDLSDIVMKALARKADERFQTAFDFDRALSTFVLKNAQSVEDTSVGQFLQQMFREEFGASHEGDRSGTDPTAPPSASPFDDFGRGDTAFVDRGKKKVEPTMTGTPVKLVPDRATPRPLAREIVLKTQPVAEAAPLSGGPTERHPGVRVGNPMTEEMPGVSAPLGPGRPSRPLTEQMPAHKPSKTPSRRFDPLPIGQASGMQPAAKLPTPAPRSAVSRPLPVEPREDAVSGPVVVPRSKTPMIVGGLALVGVLIGVGVVAFSNHPKIEVVAPDPIVMKADPPPTDPAPGPAAGPVVTTPSPAPVNPVQPATTVAKTEEDAGAKPAAPVTAQGGETKPSTPPVEGPKPPPPTHVVEAPKPAAPVRMGQLSVKVKPFANVLANGRTLANGVEGPKTFNLAPGSYEIEFVRNTLHKKEHVVIKPGETTSLEFNADAE